MDDSKPNHAVAKDFKIELVVDSSQFEQQLQQIDLTAFTKIAKEYPIMVAGAALAASRQISSFGLSIEAVATAVEIQRELKPVSIGEAYFDGLVIPFDIVVFGAFFPEQLKQRQRRTQLVLLLAFVVLVLLLGVV